MEPECSRPAELTSHLIGISLDFERRAEDLSVAYPTVVHHYREARIIADRHSRKAASTEDLRQALVHYRALFDDLLEVREPERRRA